MKRLSTIFALTLLLIAFSALSAFAQITPSDDSYTLTSTPTVNFGAKNYFGSGEFGSNHLPTL
jgi:hypothetical protein